LSSTKGFKSSANACQQQTSVQDAPFQHGMALSKQSEHLINAKEKQINWHSVYRGANNALKTNQKGSGPKFADHEIVRTFLRYDNGI